MNTNLQWQPPQEPPAGPPTFDPPGPKSRKPWLPAAIIGAAIIVAGGLIASAVLFKGDSRGSTCQAWSETQATLRAIPALPVNWTWSTPDIDNMIRDQNEPVGKALDSFEGKFSAQPADVAQAAEDYVAARRKQMRSLTDRSYAPADGTAVDNSLKRLDQLCGIRR